MWKNLSITEYWITENRMTQYWVRHLSENNQNENSKIKPVAAFILAR